MRESADGRRLPHAKALWASAYEKAAAQAH
jgi:hypothetical protein